MRTSAANTRLIEATKDASESSAAAVKRRLLTASAPFVFMLQQSILELRRQTKTVCMVKLPPSACMCGIGALPRRT